MSVDMCYTTLYMKHSIFLSPYNPKDHEDNIYQMWIESGFFNPDVCIEKGVTDPEAPYFSMVLPPPNVTGVLHMGSAFMLALEDSMTRYHRMKGERTLWLPGTDHAAIATQSKVEKIIQKEEGKNRYDLGREAFLKRVESFAHESHDAIVHQMKKIGCSLDWSREAFTLDADRNLAVKTAFKRMYDDGIIYRGKRITNWDPKGGTTISDDEVEYKEEQTTLYYLQYGPFVISTARPETKFGDKYVVMHPDDTRYAQYTHGQKITVPWIQGTVEATIIKDACIDMEFGTGVRTITPWHSAVDFDIAERHGLSMEQIIDLRGKMLPIAGECAGMKIADARAKVIEILKTKGLVVKEEAYTHNIAVAERTGGIIEPQVLDQWFINVNKEFPYPYDTLPGITKGSMVSLKKLMLSVIEHKSIDIMPERFEKVYVHWIENLRDWCISRQIWYGHRIPVWYKDAEVYCGIEAPSEPGWEQDTDTLDTWFSSGLWTFSTLGWPKDTADLRAYHPTSILETGYDIIFFWVARMILMSTYLVGTVPFRKVYLHGIVRDKDGKKISKSLGNNIDPLDMIDTYGADAIRMALIIGTSPGNDSKISVEKCKAYKHFGNKLWNITRFVLEQGDIPATLVKPALTEEDCVFIEEFETKKKEISEHMEKYRLYLAAEDTYHYLWHTFADIIIEKKKKSLANEAEKESAVYTLQYILTQSLILLHPCMPFITEKIWQELYAGTRLLMVTQWPRT